MTGSTDDGSTAPGYHDGMHPVTSDSASWTETVWFAWIDPARKLLGYFYPVFRPNLGVQGGGVLIVDNAGELPWELPVHAFGELAPIDPQLDLRHMSLANGMWLRCVEPDAVFEFGYADDDVTFDLRFEAIIEPLVTNRAAPFSGAGHLDQTGRVTGTMELRGEQFRVDCFAVRDRGWGPRRFGRGIGVGYSYGTASEDAAFLVVSSGRRDAEKIRMGYLLSDGVRSEIVSGTRVVERDPSHRPDRIVIDATDELGRRICTSGVAVSRHTFCPYPSMLTWDSLVQWDFGGADAWGEDQDVWHPDDWRDLHRSG